MVEHPHIVQVLYGPGTYIPEITSSTAPNLSSFYLQLTSSGVDDWLNEYNSSWQTLGRGGFVQAVQISPAAAHNGSTISDADIQAELSDQFRNLGLQRPDDNTIYAISFPKGKTVSLDNQRSCLAFCAYHSTFTYGHQDVMYAVLPDLTDGNCPMGCGKSTTFDNQTMVASHEIVETITDAEVGLTTSVGYPLAWYDADGDWGEIGDICLGKPATFKGRDGFTYTIQQEFSNQADRCIAGRPRSPSDIYWRYTNGQLAIWWSGTTTQPPGYPALVDPAWQILAVGDFDGDGMSDLLWRYTGPSGQTNHGQLAIWFNGTNTRPPAYPGIVPDDAWQVQGLGDFDGDGQSDILWRYSNGQLLIWWSGGVARPVSYPALVDNSWQVKGIGDFDGDGKSDILWRHTSGQLAIWWGGFAGPNTAYPLVLDNLWQIIAVADFDGDGKSDIYGRHSTGQLTIWWSGGTSTRPPTSAGAVSSRMQLQAVGDFDGDGTSDLYWRQTNSGQLWIWFSGTTVRPPANPGVVADTGWRVQGAGGFDF